MLLEFGAGVLGALVGDRAGGWFGQKDRADRVASEGYEACAAIDQVEHDCARGSEGVVGKLESGVRWIVDKLFGLDPARQREEFDACVAAGSSMIDEAAGCLGEIADGRDEAIRGCYEELLRRLDEACVPCDVAQPTGTAQSSSSASSVGVDCAVPADTLPASAASGVAAAGVQASGVDCAPEWQSKPKPGAALECPPEPQPKPKPGSECPPEPQPGPAPEADCPPEPGPHPGPAPVSCPPEAAACAGMIAAGIGIAVLGFIVEAGLGCIVEQSDPLPVPECPPEPEPQLQPGPAPEPDCSPEPAPQPDPAPEPPPTGKPGPEVPLDQVPEPEPPPKKVAAVANAAPPSEAPAAEQPAVPQSEEPVAPPVEPPADDGAVAFEAPEPGVAPRKAGQW